jgi:hypothetical protein
MLWDFLAKLFFVAAIFPQIAAAYPPVAAARNT